MNEELNDAYIQEVGKQKLLSDAEEQQLAEKIAQGNKRALDKLVAANLSYVISVANQYKNRGLSMDDLVSEGNIGMLKAATHFDGKRFVTYAAPYIREAIEQAIEQQAGLYRVPRNAKAPAWEKKRSHPLSIDAPIGGSNELSLGHVIPDKDATQPDNALEDETATAELWQIIDKLDARSRQVIQRFYGIGAEHRTLAETAQEMGLKRERVRQIRNQAIRKLCKLSKNKNIKSFLLK
ncbi:sigma-70 family RNA polymerase sigma factor [Hallella absiana]|uniref:sigma-70 family RNA polymerase sigma factor n=1 Tax=Hallella absiana TaxID=2925336 RepID=UPI0021C692DE|nr:sigma-70 family RNA polymerase sigma factor [Hallella absiana]